MAGHQAEHGRVGRLAEPGQSDPAGGHVDLGDVGRPVPCTELNEPPRNALPQPPLNAMLFTLPLTFGSQPVMVNGAVAES